MGKIDPLYRQLLTALIEYEAIKTNTARAKRLKSLADKLISIAKKNDISARREAKRYLFKEELVKKLFTSIAPRFSERTGGYTRITRIGYRKGDAVPLSFLEIIDRPIFSKKEIRKKRDEKRKKRIEKDKPDEQK